MKEIFLLFSKQSVKLEDFVREDNNVALQLVSTVTSPESSQVLCVLFSDYSFL